VVSVSVLIPTLNEVANIGPCVEHLAGQGADEVIVSDAHSPDGTAEWAERAGAVVVRSPKGRGVQQNQAASVASGQVFLFLHADCRLEPGAIDCLRRFVARSPRVPGGCFRMQVDAPDWLFRPIDASAHLRAGVFGYPYGDQGVFVTRWAFDQVGGFPELPLMDDLLLSGRLRRLGRLALLPKRIFVSPRRWRRYGIIGQSVRNWALTVAVAGGIGPQTLARYYPEVR